MERNSRHPSVRLGLDEGPVERHEECRPTIVEVEIRRLSRRVHAALVVVAVLAVTVIALVCYITGVFPRASTPPSASSDPETVVTDALTRTEPRRGNERPSASTASVSWPVSARGDASPSSASAHASPEVRSTGPDLVGANPSRVEISPLIYGGHPPSLLRVTTPAPVQELPARANQKDHETIARVLVLIRRYVKWPTSHRADTFVIDVLGDDPFGLLLDEVFRRDLEDGPPIEIRRSHNVDELGDPEMLFVSDSERVRIPDILADLRDRSVLTVGETDGFAKSGGMIEFATVEGKITFKVNPAAARRAGLGLDSRLLQLATEVSN